MEYYYYMLPTALFPILSVVFFWFRAYAKQQANRNQISNTGGTTENIGTGGYPQQPMTQQGDGNGGFGYPPPPPQPNGINTNPMFQNNQNCKL